MVRFINCSENELIVVTHCVTWLTCSNNTIYTSTHIQAPTCVWGGLKAMRLTACTNRYSFTVFISPVQLYGIWQINPVSSRLSSVHTQMVLFCLFTALQVVTWVRCYAISSNIFISPSDLCRFTASNLEHPARFDRRKTRPQFTLWVKQLISVTGTVCTMGTHALRVLRGVVDLSRRSHVQWRGHRWSQVTHWVKHWRPKSWLIK